MYKIFEKFTILTGGSIPTLLANTRKGSFVVHTRPTIFTWELVAFVHIYFLKITFFLTIFRKTIIHLVMW